MYKVVPSPNPEYMIVRKCPGCPKKFLEKKHLVFHVERRHNDPEGEEQMKNIGPEIYLEEVKKSSRATQTQIEMESRIEESPPPRISLETIAAAVQSLESKFESQEREKQRNSSNNILKDLKKTSETQTFIPCRNEIIQTGPIEKIIQEVSSVPSVESKLESQERFWRARFRSAEEQFKEKVAMLQQDLEQRLEDELNLRIRSRNSTLEENEDGNESFKSTPSRSSKPQRTRKSKKKQNKNINESETETESSFQTPKKPQNDKPKKETDHSKEAARERNELAMSYIQSRFTEAEEQFKEKVENLQKDLEEKMLGELNCLLQKRNSHKLTNQKLGKPLIASTPLKFIEEKKKELIRNLQTFDETESFAESIIEDDTEKSSVTRGPAGENDEYAIIIPSKFVRYKSKDEIHEYEEPKEMRKDPEEVASDYSASDLSAISSLSEGEENEEYEERAIDVERTLVESQVMEKMKSLGIEERPMSKYEKNDALVKIQHDRRKSLTKDEKDNFVQERENVKQDLKNTSTKKKIRESMKKNRIIKNGNQKSPFKSFMSAVKNSGTHWKKRLSTAVKRKPFRESPTKKRELRFFPKRWNRNRESKKESMFLNEDFSDEDVDNDDDLDDSDEFVKSPPLKSNYQFKSPLKSPGTLKSPSALKGRRESSTSLSFLKRNPAMKLKKSDKSDAKFQKLKESKTLENKKLRKLITLNPKDFESEESQMSTEKNHKDRRDRNQSGDENEGLYVSLKTLPARQDLLNNKKPEKSSKTKNPQHKQQQEQKNPVEIKGFDSFPTTNIMMVKENPKNSMQKTEVKNVEFTKETFVNLWGQNGVSENSDSETSPPKPHFSGKGKEKVEWKEPPKKTDNSEKSKIKITNSWDESSDAD